MTQLVFGNQDQTILATAIDANQLSISVAAGTGAQFPSISETQSLKLTIVSATNQLVNEIVLATAKTGDVFTVVRGQEGTAARAWPVGSFVVNLMTAGTGESFVQGYELENGYYSASLVNMDAITGNVSSAPTTDTSLVNKLYVDSIISSDVSKAQCQVSTVSNVTLSGLQIIDGYQIVALDRILVKNQTNPADNGIYKAAISAWSRSSDMDTWAEVPGSMTFVNKGDLYENTGWSVVADKVGQLGVDPINWTQFAGVGTYTAGTGLTLSSSQFSITDTGVVAGTYGLADSVSSIVLNEQGQVSEANDVLISIAADQINTAIPNSGLENSTISGVELGESLSALSSGSGISSFSYDGSAAGTVAIDASVVATLTGVQTLTNKTISGSNNTLANIGNASLTNSGITINGDLVNLGGSVTVTAATAAPLTISTGLSGASFDGSVPVTISIEDTGVSAGSYGMGSETLIATVNAQGQATSLSSTPIAISSSQVSGLGTMSTQDANAVSITGGTISGLTGLDNSPIGLATASSGSFTTLSASDAVNFSNYTGYVFANGASEISAASTIPTEDLSGTITNAQLDNSELTINGVSISLGGSEIVPSVTENDLTIGTGLNGTSFNGSAPVTISLANTAVTAGSFGSESETLVATVNAQGQITDISEVAIAISSSQVSGLGTMAAQNSDSIAVTGGTISGLTGLNDSPIGDTTPSSGSFTTLSSSTDTTLIGQSGYVFANDTLPVSSSLTIPTADLSGTITNAQLANSGLTINGVSISLGGTDTITAETPNVLTISTGLTGNSFDGSAPVTIRLDTIGSGGTVGSQNEVSIITYDTTGRITSASDTNIDGIALTSGTISTAPTAADDIVNKAYVDLVAGGGSGGKLNVDVATLANITLSGEQTIDGVLTSSSRVLVKNQTLAENNGIYVSNSGAWTRALDVATWDELISAIVFIYFGSQADSGWVSNSQPGGTIGVTDLDWVEFTSAGGGGGSYTAGTGLTLSANQFSITDTTVTAGSYGTASDVSSYTVNAQGQLTASSEIPISIAASQINTAIPNAGLANSTISGISLGGNLNSLSIGTGLTGSAYDGSAPQTVAIDAGVVATLTDTQTLTNKTIDYAFNTLTGVANSGANANITSLTGLTTPLSPDQGGLGVDNGTSTVTLGGNLTTAGAFSSTFTMTAATNVTFPTSGTLATTATASGIVNAGSINEIAFYSAAGDAVSGLATANDGVLVTGATGVPSVSTTLPSGIDLSTPGAGILTNCTGLPLTTGATGVLPIANGGTNVSTVTTAPTPSSFAGWDANANLSANSVISDLTTTVTSSGTTTLTSSSTENQYFTGTLPHTVVLPAVNTLALGQKFNIQNFSSASVTVQTSGLNTVQILTQLSCGTFTVRVITGTGTASWGWTFERLNGAVNTVAAGGTGVATLTGLALGNGAAAFTAVTTSAGLRGAISDETGTGSLVFATSPTFVTPLLGTPTSGVLTNCTGTATGLTAGNAANLFNTVACTVTDSTGRVTYPAQPMFNAYNSTGQTNVTGNGTSYNVICNVETIDVGNYYNNATGVFTAPIAGTYLFTATITVSGVISSQTSGFAGFTTPGLDTFFYQGNPYAERFVATGQTTMSGAKIIRLAAGITCRPQVNISGGTAVVDIVASDSFTNFQGFLLG